MSDKELLELVYDICSTNTQADWMFTELIPNEEFREICNIIESRGLTMDETLAAAWPVILVILFAI